MKNTAVLLVLCACGASSQSQVEPYCSPLLGAEAFREPKYEFAASQTDFAIDGAGFFVVSDGSMTAFTRRGQFRLDDDGSFVTAKRFRLQGFAAEGSDKLADLRLANTLMPPQPTSQVTVKANLDANASVPAAAFDPLDPVSTSNFSTSTTVYDPVGKACTVDLYWSKTAPSTWDFHAVTDGANVNGGVAGQGAVIANGSLIFNVTGRLSAVTQSSNFNPINSEQTQALAFDFGLPIAYGGSGLDGVVQFASVSSTTFTSQDGHAMGFLQRYDVDLAGMVRGAFTNGTTRDLGRVALALFPAAGSLHKVTDQLSVASGASGDARVFRANTNGTGLIMTGALEVLPAGDTSCF